MNNLYLYFSGTGNTKYVVDTFSSLYEETNEYTVQSIENNNYNYNQKIRDAAIIFIAYPIYVSMLPFIMKDFLEEYKESFRGKEIVTIATQMLFSGDGAALAYRKLKKVDVKLLHSIHIKMPGNLTDVSMFKSVTVNESCSILEKADKRIKDIVLKIKSGKHISTGRKFYSWLVGYFTQRLWGKLFLQSKRSGIKIDSKTCIQCKLCVDVCPMNNLYLENGMIKQNGKCTWCYRCINSCPTKAISLFAKKSPKIQYIRKKYN